LVPNPAKGGLTAFGKRPVDGPVEVRAPGTAKGESGLEGDAIGDKKHHGGNGQAVYAFAREDLDSWAATLGRELPDGAFGENLTTVGIDPNRALIGEHWQVGERLVLQVTSPRLPCKTFALWLGENGWIRRFTEVGRPGAYLSVVQPGPVRAGDPVVVVRRPSHRVSISAAMYALTTKPELLSDLLAAGDDLPEEMRQNICTKLR
jgi:MOSC domain-containing protein YiiM